MEHSAILKKHLLELYKMDLTKQEQEIIKVIREEQALIKYGKIEIEALVKGGKVTNIQTIRIRKSTQLPYIV